MKRIKDETTGQLAVRIVNEAKERNQGSGHDQIIALFSNGDTFSTICACLMQLIAMDNGVSYQFYKGIVGFSHLQEIDDYKEKENEQEKKMEAETGATIHEASEIFE